MVTKDVLLLSLLQWGNRQLSRVNNPHRFLVVIPNDFNKNEILEFTNSYIQETSQKYFILIKENEIKGKYDIHGHSCNVVFYKTSKFEDLEYAKNIFIPMN